jgi:asparagine synthase (glutamine-hydrolysing)
MNAVHVNGFLLRVRPSAPQPLLAWPDPVQADGLQVWFRGYLARPQELGISLAVKRGACAAEVAAAAWRRWRTGIADQLQGEFAAVVVDGLDVAVLGDRMGLRPIYWCAARDEIVVSTDLEVLARETGSWAALDEEYLADLFASGRHLGARTPYRDVRRLRAGECALWRAGDLRVWGGWRPREPEAGGTLDDHCERLRSIVQQVVRDALPNGPVGVSLSGGLDSSTVLAAVPRTVPACALSFVFPGIESSDESAWIRAALEAHPIPSRCIDGVEQGHFSAGPEFGVFFGAPSPVSFAWALVEAESAAAREAGVEAILTGEGGDAVFLGGVLPWYLADLLRTGGLARLRTEVSRWADCADPPRVATYWLHRAALGGWWSWRTGKALSLSPTPSVSRLAPWLAADFIADRRLEGRQAGAGPIRAASVHSQSLVDAILECCETIRSNEALASREIESRHPLLAPPLVDLALETPWAVGVDPRIDRAVQRYAFQGIVSPAVLRRRSKGHPEEAILRGLERNPAWVDFLMAQPHIVERGYADPRRWTEAVMKARVGNVASIRHFGAAVQVEVWLRHLHRVGASRLLTGPRR